MPDEMKDQIADYEAELEQSNFLKRQGAEAWAEMMIGMLGDKIKLDPDKAILFKQGFVEMMGGGPRFPKFSGQPVPVPPNSPPDPIHIAQEEGVTVMYFWRTLLASATHAEQKTDGTVVLHNYGDPLVELNPAAGAALWKFIEDYHSYERSMGGYR
jgi:hypothetical protein